MRVHPRRLVAGLAVGRDRPHGPLLVRRIAAAAGAARRHLAAGHARRLVRAVLHAGVRGRVAVDGGLRHRHRGAGRADRRAGRLRADGGGVRRRGPGHAADPDRRRGADASGWHTAADPRPDRGRAGRTRSGVDARILLVEDDPSIREVTAIGLRNAGFTVETASDGREGLDRFEHEPFDLVLLDVMLPRMDGLEVCRAIRRTSTIPVVMLTARADITRRRGRSRSRRRRLRAQAVRGPRARRPRPRGPAPRRPAARRTRPRSCGSARSTSTSPGGR